MADTAHHLTEIDEQGFTVLRDVLAPDFVAEIAAELERVEAETSVVPADNEFEGQQTLRVYNLLVHGKTF